MGPRPTNAVEFSLYKFSALAGELVGHPLDWDRFYRFVLLAHTRQVGWDAYAVQGRLKRYGFKNEIARELAEAYWHGRCALFVRKHPGNRRGHTGWMRGRGTPLT